jgi:hypothetical protein
MNVTTSKIEFKINSKIVSVHYRVATNNIVYKAYVHVLDKQIYYDLIPNCLNVFEMFISKTFKFIKCKRVKKKI